MTNGSFFMIITDSFFLLNKKNQHLHKMSFLRSKTSSWQPFSVCTIYWFFPSSSEYSNVTTIFHWLFWIVFNKVSHEHFWGICI